MVNNNLPSFIKTTNDYAKALVTNESLSLIMQIMACKFMVLIANQLLILINYGGKLSEKLIDLHNTLYDTSISQSLSF